MSLHIPHWLRFEIAHLLDGFRQRRGGEGWRERLNQNPALVMGATVLALLVTGGIALSFRNGPERGTTPGGTQAWFYDLNTGTLFLSHRRDLGPVAAPSGSLPDGQPAGLRAHVYSYCLDPNESERFVGFLDKPDPHASGKRPTWKQDDFQAWSQYRVVRRVEDKTWVPVDSEAGRAIFDELARPDGRGRVAIYHWPK
jgi:hypothetical protein